MRHAASERRVSRLPSEHFPSARTLNSSPPHSPMSYFHEPTACHHQRHLVIALALPFPSYEADRHKRPAWKARATHVIKRT